MTLDAPSPSSFLLNSLGVTLSDLQTRRYTGPYAQFGMSTGGYQVVVRIPWPRPRQTGVGGGLLSQEQQQQQQQQQWRTAHGDIKDDAGVESMMSPEWTPEKDDLLWKYLTASAAQPDCRLLIPPLLPPFQRVRYMYWCYCDLRECRGCACGTVC